MGKQSTAFLLGEGQAWLKRNQHKFPIKDDPVLRAIEDAKIKPTNVFEVGCADGWRLAELRKRYGCLTTGIDPGSNRSDANIYRGTADDLYVANYGLYEVGAAVDMVIYGFCLYLADREDLFRIAMEGDRILADGGHLVVYDFHPEHAHAREYAHAPDLRSYKMDYSQLWLVNPAYSLVYRTMVDAHDPDSCTSVSILKKNIQAGWPCQNSK